MLFDNEKEMLDAFLTLIEDADIIWLNPEGYDILYCWKNTKKVLSSR